MISFCLPAMFYLFPFWGRGLTIASSQKKDIPFWIFGKYGISIVDITQKSYEENPCEDKVNLIIVTDKTLENKVKCVVDKINNSGFGAVEALIRVEA